ncbi:MAG: hypothetical protein HY899_04660, partial [Deltaproteobacteria bacterium]|nr:hypothetical protein [Deltaproteobacteria bacterium]
MAGAQLQDGVASDAKVRSQVPGGARERATQGVAHPPTGPHSLARSILETLAKGGGDLLVYGALRVVWAILRGSSLERTRGVLESIGGLVGRVDRHHRRIVASNLAIAFPHWDEQARERVVDVSFRNWGRLAAEVIHAPALIAATRDDSWQQAAAAAAAARKDRRGLLVLTAHTGNFEMLARCWAARIGPLAVFHRNLGNPYVDGFLRRERLAVKMTTLGRGQSVRDALRLLAGGTSIAVALDQNQRPGHGVFVAMFGRAACTSTILARLSLATGTPVLPVFAAWQRSETVALVGDLIEPPPLRLKGDARARAIAELTQRYTTAIEAAVRRYPEQWNWAHRRWKTRP